MRPLIDADVLRYEVGAIGEGEEGEEPASFDFVAEVLDGRIADICRAVRATEPPILYLTGDTNFRNGIAVTRPYKGGRKQEKPFHFDNITAYMYNQYEVRMQEGLEADDLMSIELTKDPDNNVVCTRDKDLRMVPGWHYGWECGKQREYFLRRVEDPGHLELEIKDKKKKLTGTGTLFFYSQLLTGDSVDTIPGCPGVGPVKAFEVLHEEDPFAAVKRMYEEKGMDEEYLLEQARLLWMVRELNEDGSPVMWELPDET